MSTWRRPKATARLCLGVLGTIGLALAVTGPRLTAAEPAPSGAPAGEALRLDPQVLVYPQGGVVEIADQGRRQWFTGKNGASSLTMPAHSGLILQDP